MFGNKMKLKGGVSPSAVGAGKPQAKPKSPREQMLEALEGLAPGTEMSFRLAEMYGPEIIVVAAGKEYPANGHRFAVLGAPPVDGKPGPRRNTIWEANKVKPVADWLLLRSAIRLS